MSKVKIIHAKPVSSFNSDWLSDIFNQYLEFVPWDPDKTYPKNTLFYLNCLDFLSFINTSLELVDQLLNQGFRIIIDNLWEVDPGSIPNTHRVICPAWFWYNESLWYQHLGYDQYQPCRDIKYTALMPMNIVRSHRTDFLNCINPLLDKMMWSYVGQGRQLPDDKDMSIWYTQRYFNPEWYNKCYASMVVESIVRAGSRYTPVFITEKTMKPLAFQHPLIVYGNRGVLRQLRAWGFETFDNLWDESYDEIVDTIERRDTVIKTLSCLSIKDYDTETQHRLQHNRDHFYNHDLVVNGIIKDIVNPILEYAE